MNESGPALARFAFVSGILRGTDLTLHPTCLVHRSDRHIETLPLAGITAVRVSFERNARKLGWGIALIVIALVLLAIAGPLDRFATTPVATGPQNVPVMNYIYRVLEAAASMMPVAALACVIGGGALCVFGWLGSTVLLVSLPGSEREFPSRGRDTALLGFSEALSERLMLLKR